MNEADVRRDARVGRYIMAAAFSLGALLGLLHG